MLFQMFSEMKGVGISNRAILTFIKIIIMKTEMRFEVRFELKTGFTVTTRTFVPKLFFIDSCMYSTMQIDIFLK